MSFDLTIFGDKLYQERARRVLPILVRQAHAEQPISYGMLAAELGIPNARNLNYPLGSIGYELARLSRRWRRAIPKIQMLVFNSSTGVPGHGVYGFVGRDGLKLGLRAKRILVRQALDDIYVFPDWKQVLDELQLEPAPKQLSSSALKNIHVPRGGEGVEHLKLKRFVAKHPEVVGLSPRSEATLEYRLASADSVDVFFRTKELNLAVEVKPDGADMLEIVRGLFQCIKYRAVIAAMNGYASISVECRSVLVLGGALPHQLIALRNALGVEVFENVRP